MFVHPIGLNIRKFFLLWVRVTWKPFEELKTIYTANKSCLASRQKYYPFLCVSFPRQFSFSRHFCRFPSRLSAVSLNWSLNIEHNATGLFLLYPSKVELSFSIFQTLCAQSLQSVPTLCDPMDYSPPVSSIHGILQARILEWVAISFSKGSSWSRDWTWVSCIAGRFFTHWANIACKYNLGFYYFPPHFVLSLITVHLK